MVSFNIYVQHKMQYSETIKIIRKLMILKYKAAKLNLR